MHAVIHLGLSSISLSVSTGSVLSLSDSTKSQPVMVYIYFYVYTEFLCDGKKSEYSVWEGWRYSPHYLIVYDEERETECSFDEFAFIFPWNVREEIRWQTYFRTSDRAELTTPVNFGWLSTVLFNSTSERNHNVWSLVFLKSLFWFYKNKASVFSSQPIPRPQILQLLRKISKYFKRVPSGDEILCLS